jgi:hypothetical protein
VILMVLMVLIMVELGLSVIDRSGRGAFLRRVRSCKDPRNVGRHPTSLQVALIACAVVVE